MSSYNNLTLLGNTTRDPEIRYSSKGTAITQLSLAINRKWKDESGAEKEEVTFVECTAFGRTAETLGQYVKKGHLILIHGRLRTESWTDKESGKNRSKLSVFIEGFQFLPNKSDGAQNAPAAHRPTATHDGGYQDDNDDQSVPF